MITSPIKKKFEATILSKLKARLIEERIINTDRIHSQMWKNSKFVGDILDIKNRNNFSEKFYICFIDFKAAFDSIDHSILFNKLLNSGLDQITLNRIKLIFNSGQSLVGENQVHLNKGVP